MAFDAANLYLTGDAAPGSNVYTYRTTDTLATVIAAAYFDYGPNTSPRLVAGDMVFCVCGDGSMWNRVYSASDTTGICVMQFKGGNLPIQAWATGSAAGDFGMSVGLYEIYGSAGASATGSRGTLPSPYPGAEVLVRRAGSGSLALSFVAGASGTGTDAGNWVVGMNTYGTTATGITFEGSVRMINLTQEGEYFHVVADSTSRWRLYSHYIRGSGTTIAGSDYLLGT